MTIMYCFKTLLYISGIMGSVTISAVSVISTGIRLQIYVNILSVNIQTVSLLLSVINVDWCLGRNSNIR